MVHNIRVTCFVTKDPIWPYGLLYQPFFRSKYLKVVIILKKSEWCVAWCSNLSVDSLDKGNLHPLIRTYLSMDRQL